VQTDNYEGLYINNLLWAEGEKISEADWKDIKERFMGYSNQIFKTYKLDQNWIEEHGQLPMYFNQIIDTYINENN
jgi:hypothetical protein